MNIFKFLRENVTARQTAEFYGIEVRGRMCRCPFHDDHHPSMIVGDYFKCFSCQASGDAVEFVRRYFNIPPKIAAEKIMADFGLVGDVEDFKDYKPAVKPVQSERRWILDAADTLFEYRDLLLDWKEKYRPAGREDDFHPLFVESLMYTDWTELLLDMATSTDDDERMSLYNSYRREVEIIKQRLEAHKVNEGGI